MKSVLANQLRNPRLLVNVSSYIYGQWHGSDECFSVTNPFDGVVLAQVSNARKEEAVEAVEAAELAFSSWKRVPSKKRAELLMQWRKLILDNLDDLSTILSLEQGKSRQEARGEVLYGASYLKWFAEEATRINGDILSSPDGDKRVEVHKVAVGVVGIITPWNFPHAMISRKIAPALAAGCTVVIKPSEETPLSAIAMVSLAHEAGFPQGVINLLNTTHASEVGKVLCHDQRVRKLSFTGSTAVGKVLLEQSASNVQKVSMELGGNAPFIVFDDADIEKSILGLLTAKLRNSGQTCISPNRIFVHDSVYPNFKERLLNAVKGISYADGGNNVESDYLITPLINDTAVDKALMLVGESLEQGALLASPKQVADIRHIACPQLMTLVVLEAVTNSMPVAISEVFAPVINLIRFTDEDDVFAQANDTPAGLAAYVYTENRHRITSLTNVLDYGMIAVNTGTISNEMSPFGGVKHSGFGREGSSYGMDDYLQLKSVTIL